MPLTPADVHNVAFKKPPIGKRGYDEEEVDAFLDEVERELARLIEENNELRGQGRVGGASVARSAATCATPARSPTSRPSLTASSGRRPRLSRPPGRCRSRLSRFGRPVRSWPATASSRPCGC